MLVVALVAILRLNKTATSPAKRSATTVPEDSLFPGPGIKLQVQEREMILYGKDIISNTSDYFGPKGSIDRTTNGMNCQSCHLNAGTKIWGNHLLNVYTSYPKFRERSGTTESIFKRVSDCFERSLNGTTPDSNSKEFKSIFAYLKFLGDSAKKKQSSGSSIEKLPFLSRAADPSKGKWVYISQCRSCHGIDGRGKLNSNKTGYEYPPLWGNNSFNNGAGLLRISLLAGFIKNNMPYNKASYQKPTLTTEQVWDVAAYICSKQRPFKDFSKDWPDISKKPFDYPFGPFSDNFSETQHKFGPYKAIIAAKETTTDK